MTTATANLNTFASEVSLDDGDTMTPVTVAYTTRRVPGIHGESDLVLLDSVITADGRDVLASLCSDDVANLHHAAADDAFGDTVHLRWIDYGTT